MSPARPNATRADIIAMLRDGHSNTRIMRELRCDKQRVRRLRTELGLPDYVPAEQTRSLEEKWQTKTRPADGGHLEWTGTRGTSCGTPLLSYKEKVYSPAAIAFRIRTGHEPRGYVIADCGRKHCVAPDHVNDEAGRQQGRRQARAERGLGELAGMCGRGHDQKEHGLLESNGTGYCGMCKVEDKRRQRNPDLPSPQWRRAVSLQEAFQQRTQPHDDGHLTWTGSTSHSTPTLWWQGSLHSAYKLAFRLHHGRDPEGTVTSGCDVPRCVAGGCLTDRRLRAANQRADRAFAAIFGGAA
ncbi:hypothetical protein [Streptomyces chartreusis]|uniref:hypothetical protein n=1 Tax=Streptomyces chartreusis TaxID=1969 RepID=UPI0035D5B558